jgi:flagellar biosynthesis/type III secretory pathway protein FliH
MGVLTRERAQHRYQTCRDEDCQRFACRVYREGYEAGYGAGHAAGYAAGEAAGYAAGYGEGYASGAASCGDG